MAQAVLDRQIHFDVPPLGVSLAFYSTESARRLPRALLTWTQPATPWSVEEVARFLRRRKLPVDTIVIGGLAGYPLGEDRWPQWLVGLEEIAAPMALVVDTQDLSGGQRRRLIESTRRLQRLRPAPNPIDQFFRRINRWTKQLGRTGADHEVENGSTQEHSRR